MLHMDLARSIVQAAREEQPRARIQVTIQDDVQPVMYLSKNDSNKVILSFVAAGHCWRHLITKSWTSKDIRDMSINAFIEKFSKKHPTDVPDCGQICVQLMYDNQEVVSYKHNWSDDHHKYILKNYIQNIFDYYSLSF